MSDKKTGSRRFAFTAAFDWSPPEAARSVIAFRAGGVYSVRRACGEAAKAAGKGNWLSAPDVDCESAGEGDARTSGEVLIPAEDAARA